MHNLKTAEKKRQQAIAELREKFELVENAISHLTVSRECLENNASEVKAKILQDVTGILETLRKREVQLLRQIDVMEAHHLNILHTQYAELHQLLGNLRHTLYCAERQQDIPAPNITTGEMELVQAVLKQKVVPDTITYWGDVRDLDATILNFGAVATNLSTLQATKDLVSKCLPSKMEEYDDCEQQLLYKTLEEIKAKKDGGLKAFCKFPKFSDNKEDWLRECVSSVSAQPKADIHLPEFLTSTDSCYWLRNESACLKTQSSPLHFAQANSVKEWLRQIRQKKGANSMDCYEKAESGVAFPKEDQPCNVSDSIELLSHPDTISSSEFGLTSRTASFSSSVDSSGYCCISKPTPTNAKKESWLTCCGGETVNMDIENLHSIPCAANGDAPIPDDSNKWLLTPNKKALVRSFTELLQHGGVCRSNEPCGDFSECVCMEECAQRALELQAALTKDADKNGLRLSANPEAGKPTWLRAFASKDAACKKWLKSVTASHAEKVDLSEKVSDFQSHEMLEPDKTDVRADFRSYFQTGNVDTWLIAA